MIRPKRKQYRKSKPDYVLEKLNRDFNADMPNQKCCTDVTEFKNGNGKKAYLSAIIDLHDNSIVSHILDHSNNNQLVINTMIPAIQGLKKDEQLLIHSDCSYQYTSKFFTRMIEMRIWYIACRELDVVSITDHLRLFGYAKNRKMFFK